MDNAQTIENNAVKLRPIGARCTICAHPQCEEIERLLVSDNPPSERSLSKRFGVSSAAVHRHAKRHLPRKMVQAATRKKVTLADKFFDRAEILWDESRQYVADAHHAVKYQLVGEHTYERLRDIGAMAPALAQAHRNVELLGRAAGLLNEGQAQAGDTNVQIFVALPRPQQSEESITCNTIDVKLVEDSPGE